MEAKNYSVVKKHGSLLTARYGLSELSIKVLSTVISMIRADDQDFKPYTLDISAFKELMNLKRKDLHSDLRSIATELISTKIEIPLHDHGFLVTAWISSAEYRSEYGEIEFEVSPKLKPYLIELKENFLQYELKNILALKSSYVIRLYELLKHEYNKINRYTGNKVVSYEISVSDLREQFKIPKSYQYSSHIKKLILDKAVKQFESKTDITITYEEHKRGRKVDLLTFTIRENDHQGDHLISEKSFIKFMRSTFVNRDIWKGQGMVLSISAKGRIYDKITGKDYSKDQSLKVWATWYQLAKDHKLEVLEVDQGK